MLEDVEWALSEALEILEEYYPSYYTDSKINQILDIYNTNFD